MVFRFHSLSEVPHAVSTRRGGVSSPPYDTLNVGYGTPDDESAVAANRARLITSVGVPAEGVVAARLTHGNKVSVFRADAPDERPVEYRPVRPGSQRIEPFFSTDGVVSDVPGLSFLLTFADCVPLLFHDRVRNIVGAAHAGWRGTVAAVGPAVVDAMRREFGSMPRDIVACIGPCIGVCCYAVGQDVLEAFAAAGEESELDRRAGSTFLDLAATNERQLRACGVRLLEQAGICTACDTQSFYSHRAEHGRTGRFALVAGLAAA